MCILHTILHFIPIVLWAGSHLIPVCTPVFTCPSLLLPFLFISYPNFGEWVLLGAALPQVRWTTGTSNPPPVPRSFFAHSPHGRCGWYLLLSFLGGTIPLPPPAEARAAPVLPRKASAIRGAPSLHCTTFPWHELSGAPGKQFPPGPSLSLLCSHHLRSAAHGVG